MSAIDLDALLQEVSPDAPCGEDLEYDPAFGELERTARGTEEQQIGDTVVDATEPDWREVRKMALGLLARTKDMRVLLYLVRAAVHTDGYAGLYDALRLFQGLVERYWSTIHPELDPDDDYDPTMRVNILTSLCDSETLLRAVREAPLVESRVLGRFGLRDLAIASGEVTPSGGEAIEMSTIDGAFTEVEVDQLQATQEAVSGAMQAVRGIEGFVTEQVGAANAASLDDLVKVLREAEGVLGDRLARRGVGEAPEAEAGGEAVPGAVGGTGAPAAGAVAPQAALSGEIHSRDDVIRALDKVRAYYTRYEPTSPVPMLMERAKRLVTMNFLEIIQNLAPDGMGQVEVIRGPEETEEGQGEGW